MVKSVGIKETEKRLNRENTILVSFVIFSIIMVIFVILVEIFGFCKLLNLPTEGNVTKMVNDVLLKDPRLGKVLKDTEYNISIVKVDGIPVFENGHVKCSPEIVVVNVEFKDPIILINYGDQAVNYYMSKKIQVAVGFNVDTVKGVEIMEIVKG
ncbi:MAG: hypothetical protein JHC26_09660 [Thermofilum sp.]|uniref:hypothetical protein n=1 Tax=Thermofilum sp. TaxID=1961369 RepID=UPI0025910BA4|nr:hypothetical protein [Thermofilum sp.]MCI4409347.1 hypothetical protein [Thermofilum sp.]